MIFSSDWDRLGQIGTEWYLKETCPIRYHRRCRPKIDQIDQRGHPTLVSLPLYCKIKQRRVEVLFMRPDCSFDLLYV